MLKISVGNVNVGQGVRKEDNVNVGQYTTMQGNAGQCRVIQGNVGQCRAIQGTVFVGTAKYSVTKGTSMNKFRTK